MAGIRLLAQTPEIASGTSRKTILQIVAAANHRVVLREWSIQFQGVSNTQPPVLVQLFRQSTVGLGGDALTLIEADASVDETIQTTAQSNIDGTTQPVDGDLIMSELVHPQGGYTWQAPFGGEIFIGGGTRLGLTIDPANSMDVTARMILEE